VSGVQEEGCETGGCVLAGFERLFHESRLR
jgi:hypothetical protein